MRRKKQLHYKSQNNVSYYLDCWKERVGVVKKEKKNNLFWAMESCLLYIKRSTVGIDGKQGLHFISFHFSLTKQESRQYLHRSIPTCKERESDKHLNLGALSL